MGIAPALPQDAPLAARLLVDEAGIYVVAFDDLRAAGLDLPDTPSEKLNIYHCDDAIPSLVLDGGDGAFGPGDRICFIAEAVSSVYAPHNVYWLRVGDAEPSRPGKLPAAEFGSPEKRFTATVRFNPQNFYVPTIPKQPDSDHWFAGRVTDGRPAKLKLQLPGLDAAAQQATRMRVGLHGFSTLPPDPDHRTLVKLGDETLATDTWDGDVPHVIEATVETKLLTSSDSELVVAAHKPEGVQFDVAQLDWVEVAYPRTFDAPSGFLTFPAVPNGGSYEVTGLPGEPIVVWRADGPTRVSAVPFDAGEDGGKHTARFADAAAPEGAQYVVASAEGMKHPVAIESDRPSSLRDESRQADYLVIAHGSLLDAVQPLAEYRRKQGLTVLVADVQDVYDEFNCGIAEPIAIKRFVDFAYHQFKRPAPRFVLLVGDASYDYKGYKEKSLPNLVPTYLVHTDPFGETGSDDWFACVDGDDVAPDLALGRISARRPETVAAIVRKTLTFETAQPKGGWARRAILAADNGILPGQFEPEHQRICDEAARVLEERGWQTEKLYIEPGSENAKDVTEKLKLGVDAGCKFVVYAGHAIFDHWAAEKILTADKAADFRNGDKTPFVVSLSCLDGMFYHATRERCLAEEWVANPHGGAVAYWSPTGMSYPAAHAIMLREFMAAALSDEVETLGEAVRIAKGRMLKERPDTMGHDSAIMFTYFGDPGLSARAWRGEM